MEATKRNDLGKSITKLLREDELRKEITHEIELRTAKQQIQFLKEQIEVKDRQIDSLIDKIKSNTSY